MLVVSQWIEHAQVVVSTTSVYQNHAIASEIVAKSRDRRWNLAEHISIHAVVSAASVPSKKHKVTSEMTLQTLVRARAADLSRLSLLSLKIQTRDNE
jgi:hypothetical protein